jgi:hypothetical protein
MGIRKINTLAPATGQPIGGRLFAACTICIALVTGMLAMVGLPGPLAMPTLGIVLALSGLLLAAGSYVRGLRFVHGGRAVGNYDIAGALVVLGFAAALMTDAEQALVLLDRIGE